jgi:predicted metal-dependent HD superfamily phosphohydrolase
MDAARQDEEARILRLHARFLSLGGKFSDFSKLVEAYGEEARRYHVLSHVEFVIDTIEQFYPEAPAWVYWAAFYHDFVYDPRRHDNEERSGDEAMVAGAEHFGPSIVDVVRSIRMTAKHDLEACEGFDEALLVGDLMGLAIPRAEYEANTARIRQEYSMFSDVEWYRGRAAFIESYGSRRIFPREERFDEYENAAHANMQAELEKLRNNF